MSPYIERRDREPFAPGNEAAVRHGAYSPRKVNPVAERIVEAIVEDAPYLADPAYALAVWALARIEATRELLAEYIVD